MSEIINKPLSKFARRMKLPDIFWIIACMFVLTSCGNDGTFRINSTIENFGTGNLRVVYIANGAIQSVVAPAVDGKFSMTGRLDRPTLARIYTGNGNVVGRLIVKPGETIEATFDITDPTAVKFNGDNDSEKLAKFLSENAEYIKNSDTASLNAAIADYVRKNTNRLVSGLLMADYFTFTGNEALATELMNLLTDEVAGTASVSGLLSITSRLSTPSDSLSVASIRLFGTSDSLKVIDPADKARTLLMFTNVSNRNADSIKALEPMLQNPQLRVIDISCDPDTATWHASLKEQNSTRTDAKVPHNAVERYWTPAPFNLTGLDEISIASVPWFIAADSTGRVLYRGPSASAAHDAMK